MSIGGGASKSKSSSTSTGTQTSNPWSEVMPFLSLIHI